MSGLLNVISNLSLLVVYKHALYIQPVEESFSVFLTSTLFRIDINLLIFWLSVIVNGWLNVVHTIRNYFDLPWT